jgi:hypothetical protein
MTSTDPSDTVRDTTTPLPVADSIEDARDIIATSISLGNLVAPVHGMKVWIGEIYDYPIKNPQLTYLTSPCTSRDICETHIRHQLVILMFDRMVTTDIINFLNTYTNARTLRRYITETPYQQILNDYTTMYPHAYTNIREDTIAGMPSSDDYDDIIFSYYLNQERNEQP